MGRDPHLLGAQFLASCLGGLVSTALAGRFGVRRSLGAGFLVMTAGLLLLLTGRWPVVAAASAMWGFGLGLVVPEMNRGQLCLEVERVVGRHKVLRVNRLDGEFIVPAEILAAIEDPLV